MIYFSMRLRKLNFFIIAAAKIVVTYNKAKKSIVLYAAQEIVIKNV